MPTTRAVLSKPKSRRSDDRLARTAPARIVHSADGRRGAVVGMRRSSWSQFIPGAHGHGENDGSAVVQFDLKTKTRKVIALLHPYFKDKIGAIPTGTFSSAIDPAGDKLYITWNVKRGAAAWDCCALTVIHIPEAERRP